MTNRDRIDRAILSRNTCRHVTDHKGTRISRNRSGTVLFSQAMRSTSFTTSYAGCWFTNAVRGRVYPHIADAILGHGDKKKSLQSLYLTLSDDDLIKAIDMMMFDIGETDIRVTK